MNPESVAVLVAITLGIFVAFLYVIAKEPANNQKHHDDDRATIQDACNWAHEFFLAVTEKLESGKWLDSEFRSTWKQAMPGDPRKGLRFSRSPSQLPFEMETRWQFACEIFDSGLDQFCESQNQILWSLQMERSADLFDQIEAQPLTYEQRAAATNFENRIQVVAAAGSGKTSVMVAKAAHAVRQGLVKPERVLMLAFNKDAANELHERTKKAFRKTEVQGASKVSINTFHAFGLSLIGEATGVKPRLAPWAESETQMANKAQKLISEARKNHSRFATDWYLLKMVYFRELAEFGEDGIPEDWDAETKQRGKRTLSGEIVRSDEERLIANWLFVHDINYVYEHPYKYATSNSVRSQYHPDFYYPDIDVYHEHFALDRSGQPPAHFENYLDGVRWKRLCHQESGTVLFETTSAEIRGGTDFLRMQEMFISNGLVPKLNPSKRPKGFEPVGDADLIKLLLTVLSHFKSNRMTIESLRQRVQSQERSEGAVRRQVFLRIFEQFIDDWQAALRANNYVDFHDMLIAASDAVEDAPETSRYDLILVDEFQDTSVARLGLIEALCARPGVQLTVVGDDWQSVNRFAGADLSVMTSFDAIFPGAVTLALTRTFRCDQAICDVSSIMIMKNANQQRKKVVGQTRGVKPHVRIHYIDEVSHPGGRVEARRNEIKNVLSILPRPKPGEVKKVFVLGRYGFELEGLDGGKFGPGWDVRVMTIHRAKGLEADFVIIVGVNTDSRYGFPSKKSDDPLQSLVMPVPELFPHAEERRLLYVALTRAKECAVLVTAQNSPSEFVNELRIDFPQDVECFGLSDSVGGICPRCNGALVRKTAKKSEKEFIGCRNFPRCDYTSWAAS